MHQPDMWDQIFSLLIFMGIPFGLLGWVILKFIVVLSDDNAKPFHEEAVYRGVARALEEHDKQRY